jgi:hypothetical protein
MIWLIAAATMSQNATRKVTELGLLVSILGAVALGLGNIRRPHSVPLVLGGALAIAVGLVLVVVAVHWGVNPYEPRPRTRLAH